MPYFDQPPGQRVLREFTIRHDECGRWIVSETHGQRGVFLSCEEALRFALYETPPGYISNRPRRFCTISGRFTCDQLHGRRVTVCRSEGFELLPFR
jgi:hypothetical protein